MKLYLLIHEQDTDSAWGCTVQSFLNMADAHTKMRADLEKTAKEWNYGEREHKDEDKCYFDDNSAVIRDGDDMELWRIEEQELDVRVAVRVKGGMVQSAYSNTGAIVDVYDLDTSDWLSEKEQSDVDRRAAELEDLVKSPGWRAVW